MIIHPPHFHRHLIHGGVTCELLYLRKETRCSVATSIAARKKKREREKRLMEKVSSISPFCIDVKTMQKRVILVKITRQKRSPRPSTRSIRLRRFSRLKKVEENRDFSYL